MKIGTRKKQPSDSVDLFAAEWTRERPDLAFRYLPTLGRIIRVSAHLRESMDNWLAPAGLSWEIFDLLVSLRRSGAKTGMRPTELYDACILSSGATTNRINRAAKLGYVVRRPDPEDGRATRIALTPRGHAIIDRTLTEHHTHMQEISDRLAPKEQVQLSRLLRKLLLTQERPKDGKQRKTGGNPPA